MTHLKPPPYCIIQHNGDDASKDRRSIMLARPFSTKASNVCIYISTPISITYRGALPSHHTTTVHIKGPSGEKCYLHPQRANLAQVDGAMIVRRK